MWYVFLMELLGASALLFRFSHFSEKVILEEIELCVLIFTLFNFYYVEVTNSEVILH